MSSYTSAEQAAIDYINTLNNNAYNPSTNPGGFDNNGHRVNFILSLTENLKLIDAALRFANVAEASSSELTATSSSSVTIGTGTKNFTIETGKAFVEGQTVKIVDDAAPTTNIMIGSVISYDSGTGALSVDVTSTQGSGTLSDWIISIQTGINNVVEDSTPQLGGTLDAQENNIIDSTLAVNVVGSTASNTDMDISLYNAMQIEPTADISVTFSNIPATGNFVCWVVEIKGGGDHTFTWPAAVKWSNGNTEPTWSTGTDSDWALFMTRDGGATISGSLLMGELPL